MKSLNIILYGPPGTGKTYRTSALAVQQLEDLSPPHFYEQYPVNNRLLLQRRIHHHRDEGRYAFVVFHPSFSYEDFVEGIKPYSNERHELLYRVEDGIFKQMCIRAAHALYLAQQTNALTPEAPQRHDFDALFFEFIDYLKRSIADDSQETVFESKTGKPFYLVDINSNNTLSLRMGRGQQTYSITKSNLNKLYRTFTSAREIKSLRRDMPPSVRRISSVAWAVFNRLKHFEATRNQTYRYLLEGRGSYNTEHYQAMKRDVQRLDYARLTSEDYAAAGRFVLVIDEINRGNVAAIFGELIALLEPNKRAGHPEALQTTLPYSREPFSVPPNLWLIGTMNTADRSTAALDTALRRRFAFEAMHPDPTLLGPLKITVPPKEYPPLNMAAESEAPYASRSASTRATYTVDLRKLLEVINQRLAALLGADQQLGHGYFMPLLAAEAPLTALRQIIYQQVIPLLQEHFFNETEKIALVLGQGFFHSAAPPSLLFAPGASEEERMADELYTKEYRLRQLTDPEFVETIIQTYESL